MERWLAGDGLLSGNARILCEEFIQCVSAFVVIEERLKGHVCAAEDRFAA